MCCTNCIHFLKKTSQGKLCLAAGNSDTNPSAILPVLTITQPQATTSVFPVSRMGSDHFPRLLQWTGPALDSSHSLDPRVIHAPTQGYCHGHLSPSVLAFILCYIFIFLWHFHFVFFFLQHRFQVISKPRKLIKRPERRILVPLERNCINIKLKYILSELPP